MEIKVIQIKDQNQALQLEKQFSDLCDTNTNILVSSVQNLRGSWSLFESVQSCYKSLDNFSSKIYFAHSCCMTPISQDLIEAIQRKYNAVTALWLLDTQLFAAYKELSQLDNLTDAQKLAIKYALRDLVFSGAELTPTQQKKLTELKQICCRLSSKFQNNVVLSSKQLEFIISQQQIKDIQSLYRPDQQDLTVDINIAGQILLYSTDRDLREQIHNRFKSLANEEPYDNKKLISEIIAVKQGIAHLLQYDNYADFAIASDIPDSYDDVKIFLMHILDQYRKPACQYLDILANFANHEIKPWDLSFYDRIYNEHIIHESNLLSKFNWYQLIQGLPKLLKQIFNLKVDIIEISESLYQLEVFDANHNTLGHILLDPFYKDGKTPGAQMCSYHTAESDKDYHVAAILCNISDHKLLQINDIRTVLHELGHALHHILTQVKQYNISGVNVQPTWVEVPSQLFECIFYDSDLVQTLSTDLTQDDVEFHKVLVKQLKYSEQLQTYVTALRALIDITIYHDPHAHSYFLAAKICNNYYQQYGLISKRGSDILTQFLHIFGGGYEARYYTYVWSSFISDKIWQEYKTTNDRQLLLNIYQCGQMFNEYWLQI